jgi:6-pyruvoyltetrahydropterin/6-carboxytetrahydropterin synthase
MTSIITASRHHDFSAGHRVYGHESKCSHLHGHNYRVHFYCTAAMLDNVGRVIDFSVIKELLCMWLEVQWDHRFMVWDQDPIADILATADPAIRPVPFNPTAENMAEYLLQVVGPAQLAGTGVTLVRVAVEETTKCSASAAL